MQFLLNNAGSFQEFAPIRVHLRLNGFSLWQISEKIIIILSIHFSTLSFACLLCWHRQACPKGGSSHTNYILLSFACPKESNKGNDTPGVVPGGETTAFPAKSSIRRRGGRIAYAPTTQRRIPDMLKDVLEMGSRNAKNASSMSSTPHSCVLSYRAQREPETLKLTDEWKTTK